MPVMHVMSLKKHRLCCACGTHLAATEELQGKWVTRCVWCRCFMEREA